MHEIIDQLQELSETVPVPLELPTFEQLVEVEEQILIGLPAELKEYLLHASNVIYSAYEPVTAADPYSHTFLPEVASYAWSIGLPREQIPICQVGDSFYCIEENGQVQFWQDGDFTDEVWESFWDWVDDVWLAQ
ncbi:MULTISPECIES: SMI1/KNR4 family protein [Pseudomonadati]|uniref:SMI1/KNR4 family protein n=2 Tax=Shewanella TaxID=22 RepID=A0ABT0KZG9_9GAMM|nr:MULTISPECIES: SMI1/KNR4 family protein [Shewanella]MCL1116822.1 SMI1/KNR4 family protein [Shewanella aestuarii]MCW3171599.1 SMI1/KNR4 family protein [Shewanella subflava]GGN73398.1 cell wall assembly protein [Shewanella aestuarii]